MSNTAVELLRQQYKQAYDWLVGTMQGLTPEVLSYVPPGDLVSPIAGQIAHVAVGVDAYLVNMVGGREMLLSTEYAERGAISEPPPQSDSWLEWGKRVVINETEIRAYIDAAFAAVDEILAGMDDDDLAKEIDLRSFGVVPLSGVFTIMLLNTFSHTGEISVIKGLQGLQGYPM